MLCISLVLTATSAKAIGLVDNTRQSSLGPQALDKAWAERRAWCTLSAHVPEIPRYRGICIRSVFFRVSHFAELIEFCSSSPLSVFIVTCSYEEAYSLNAEG